MLRFGTVPILWNNDDVPELTPPVPFEQVLDEMAQAGFVGTELGTNYPRDPQALRAALASRGMTLSGAYYCPGLTEEAAAQEALDSVDAFLDFLQAAGCETLIAAEPIRQERDAIAGRVHAVGGPTLTDAQWRTLADALNALGARCKARGMGLAFHNHAGTYVETPGELKKLLNLTEPSLVGLCLDTGHYAFGGGNPVEAIDTYRNRLRYLHLKDLDPQVKADLLKDRGSFMTALRRRIFTELGRGCVDVKAIARLLMDADWNGWVVAEQDTTLQSPLGSAKANREALVEVFGVPVAT
ncbi:MAG TPA: sugar phosphate isomerase/epimerase [Oscillatoriaceae cyanobacterium]